MQNENENEIEKRENQPEGKTVEDFITEVNEIKANSVSKDEYNKVVEEKQKLMKALINGDISDIELPNGEEQNEELLKRIQDNRNKLATSEDLSNLEYCKTALQLRDDVIEAYGKEKDPFLPNGHEYIPDDNDIKRADAVADIMRECIEGAEGNSEVFTAKLMSKTLDSGIKTNNKRR